MTSKQIAAKADYVKPTGLAPWAGFCYIVMELTLILLVTLHLLDACNEATYFISLKMSSEVGSTAKFRRGGFTMSEKKAILMLMQ